MKRILRAYCELLRILFAESPFIVIATFISTLLTGAIMPITIWVNSEIFNLGLLVASGEMHITNFIPYLSLFVIIVLIPVIVGDLFINSYIAPRCQLILRTVYKGKMLQKLKRLEYKHLENEETIEIIDKAFNRTEISACMLFPHYSRNILSSLIAVGGILYLFASLRWWLILTTVLPFLLHVWFARKNSANIYAEMEKYWKKERSYSTLGNMLRSRDYLKENRLTGVSDYLIETYKSRLSGRNREYETFYLKNLRQNIVKDNLIKIAQIGNALILLTLYMNGGISIGILIAYTLAIFTSLYAFYGLSGLVYMIKNIGFHVNTFGFYDNYFNLSEDDYSTDDSMPKEISIEFDNVYFKYPGTDRYVLKGLTFKVNEGERVSVVGGNGEGKTTMIKLLLGLFQPDSGEIRIGGKPLSSYSEAARSKLFGPVFQDFVKYSITLGENIGVGDVENVDNTQFLNDAMHKAKVDSFLDSLTNGKNTLLGRDFEGGVDLSGGQWQRIAIARAFMGNKPILILDEPTSQLDPMAESALYSEFNMMSEGKTSIFITHRLGSTSITDRILVISGGCITQCGSHKELMDQDGLYAGMFNAQKQWYVKDKGEPDYA